MEMEMVMEMGMGMGMGMEMEMEMEMEIETDRDTDRDKETETEIESETDRQRFDEYVTVFIFFGMVQMKDLRRTGEKSLIEPRMKLFSDTRIHHTASVSCANIGMPL